jgi:serine/threonine protein kinase
MFNRGDIINDRYRLVELIGRGGFSQVWKASDELSQSIVALKFFIKQDDEGINLCRQEFQRTFELQHPNIVKTIHIDVFEHSTPFLVQYYCRDGNTVDKENTFSEYEIANIVAQIGAALDYIHNAASPITHNDIKPDNFLIDQGKYLLCDFGISQKLHQKMTQTLAFEEGFTHQTIPSGITPVAYRAPELFDMKDRVRSEPSAASDIWSFGASLYRLVTGEPPFQGGGGLTQYVTLKGGNVTTDDILLRRAQKFSDEFYELIIRCLAIEPANRPTAAMLVTAANNYLTNEKSWFYNTNKEKFEPIIIPQINSNSPNKKLLIGALTSLSLILILLFAYPYFKGKGLEAKGDECAEKYDFKKAYSYYLEAQKAYLNTPKQLHKKVSNSRILSSYATVFSANEGLYGVSDTINGALRCTFVEIEQPIARRFTWAYSRIEPFKDKKALVTLAISKKQMYLTLGNTFQTIDSLPIPLEEKKEN